jgi:hypothetical protein
LLSRTLALPALVAADHHFQYKLRAFLHHETNGTPLSRINRP